MRFIKYTRPLSLMLFGVVLGFCVPVSAGSPLQEHDSDVEWTPRTSAGIPFWMAFQSENMPSPVPHRTLFVFLESHNFTLGNVSEVFKDLGSEFKLPFDLSIFVYSDTSVLKRAIDIHLNPPGCYSSENIERNLKKLEERYSLGKARYREAVYYRDEQVEEFYYRVRPSKQESMRVILKSRSSKFVLSGNVDLDLVRAAKEGASAYVDSQLSAGANIDARDESGYTALMNAASGGHKEIVKTLLEKGADVSAADDGGGTALMRAARQGDIGIVRLLLVKGADVRARDLTLGGAALADSVQHPAVTQVLLNNGADPNAQDNLGLTALMIAAANGYSITTQMLLDRGADPNARNRQGKTALTLARERKHHALAELLERFGSEQ